MDSYHVRFKGRCLGPYPLDRIRQLTRRGEVGRAHEVSTDGMSWAPATSFPEIFERADPPVATFATTAPAGVATPVAVAPAAAEPPAPVPVEPQWYCDRGGSAHGPMPKAQLIAMIQRGEVGPTTFVFREGTSSWINAADAPELAAGFTAVGSGASQPGINAFCRECGSGVSQKAIMCPKCGAPTGAAAFPSPGTTPFEVHFPAPTASARGPAGERKSKTVAAVLALLIGGFGIHHFYLGNPTLGVVYILFCWTLIPAIISFFEAIMFLVMSDASFDQKYNA